ncbi:unnamed protein product [Cercopithifilaria johnstoni]|uniref:Uncharacterized protein n=1 Tax=Cercopithifilaria johnstoni TaxID=2874296 RepID=A0A8J2QB78_9BILA|nr:unnamed protein product [Cercopithifilaria johnstoni]
MRMNDTEYEEGGNNTSSSNLPPKIRPKSHSFMDSKDIILKRNSAGDSEISRINSFEKISSLTNLHSHPKARSFLRDFRKLFRKNRTSTNTATTTAATATDISAKINYSLRSIETENEMENLNDSITQLRKKSQSWSHYEDQKLFPKCRKYAGSMFTPIRVQRSNRRMGFINQMVIGNNGCRNTVYSKVSSIRWNHFFLK